MIELTNERMIKYLNNDVLLIDFFRNILRLMRFNTIPIAPIGTMIQSIKISSDQLVAKFANSKVFESAVVLFIF